MDEVGGQAIDPERWVDEYGDYLYRYAMSRLRSPQAAEEVVQDTFYAALKSRQQYAGRGVERAWLLGILKHKIVDVIRGRSKLETGADATDDITVRLFDQRGNWREDPRVFGPQPGDALERQEFWDTFRLCLDTAPQRQADVFALRELEKKSSEEICKELQISPSNLWVLLHRARLHLANCMKSRWRATRPHSSC